MSIHSFQRTSIDASRLPKYVVLGTAVVSDAGRDTLKISLSNDGDLAALQDFLATRGFSYVSTSPVADDAVLWPDTPGLGAQTTRADQVLLEGGVYRLFERVTFNRMIMRFTVQAGAPTIALGLYQAPGGGAGVASRIASIAAGAVGAVGNFQFTPSEGLVSLDAGRVYLLTGRSSALGSWSSRCYNIQPYDLLNANLLASTRPLTYTTALAASAGLPATFDPRQFPTGTAVETSLNLMPVIRLGTV